MTLGERIKAARKKANLKQSELAELIGVSAVTIGQYERDQRQPRLKQLSKIAEALNVDLTEILSPYEQCKLITDEVVDKCGLTVVDDNGKVTHQGNGKPWVKLSDTEIHRMGFMKFNSDEDRAAHFYRFLNTDGKLAAGRCFFQHIKPKDMKEVADYVEKLSETPQYQRATTTDSDEGE